MAEARSDEYAIEGSKVLVVDDNPQNLELLVAYLESTDCQVTTALDGLEALEKIQEQIPDLIVLDIMMPHMSGFELCQKLKSDPRTREIPVLMVTALTELGDIQRGVEARTDDFIYKPVNRLELLVRVRNLLRLRHLKNELDRALAYMEGMDSSSQADQ